MAEFLLELFSEEIPARMQVRAADDLKRLVTQGLQAGGLAFDSAEAFCTPRRLTLVIDGLPLAQPDIKEERKGPRVGSPEKAIEGFLKAAGVASLDQCEVRTDDKKGPYYVAVTDRAGRPTGDVLADVVNAALPQLPWPKSMRWADHAVRWVRPLHRILALFDGNVVAVSFGPVSAGNETEGHRFLAPGRLVVLDAADYRTKLTAAKVMLDPAERRRLIDSEARRLAAAASLRLREDAGLLDEVTGLVEWPVVHMGRIDEAFMSVPQEVLITAMRSHQKYFSLLHADGRLAPHFVVVANTLTADGGTAVVAGNERVLRARLSDARFFWDQDRKVRLESRVERLKERVFHARLGSDFERAQRIRKLAVELARFVPGAETALVDRGALLCKADLSTGMVGEFPELQGVMGRYYARHDGESEMVAEAIAEHYSPLGPNDACPSRPVSVALALADKLDTLVGFFGIGEKPTGSKDPFALRRAALGVIRLVIENRLRLPLLAAFEAARAGYALPLPASIAAELLDFFADRLKVHLRDRGVRHDLVSAVFAQGGEDDLVRLLARVEALTRFLGTEDGADLLTAYKRASNIVRIEEKKDGRSYGGEIGQDMLKQAEEKSLHKELEEAIPKIVGHVREERFDDAMSVLAGLRAPVDAFFDHVTVNCEEPPLRENRLRLLSRIRSALGGVADFSKIEG